MSSQSVLLRSVRCVPKRDGIIWDTASILLGSTFLCVLLSAYRRHVRFNNDNTTESNLRVYTDTIQAFVVE